MWCSKHQSTGTIAVWLIEKMLVHSLNGVCGREIGVMPVPCATE